MRRPSDVAGPVVAAAVIVLTIFAQNAGGQSIIPVVRIDVEPLTQDVDASTGAASAVYNCSLFVEGIPYVRYRVNLTAECEGWEATCDPASFIVTGTANNTYKTTVKVPAGEQGGQARYLTLNATVSTGVAIATCTTYAVITTRQSFGLNLTSGTAGLSVTGGKTVTWAFTLKNSGNGRDTFSLSVMNLQSYTSVGWVVKFNRSLLSVDAGDIGSCTVNITPAANSKNQTVAFQIKAYSKNASYQNITVESILELQLSVHAAPGGGGDKKTTTPKGTPGMEAIWLALALALAALAGMARRV